MLRRAILLALLPLVSLAQLLPVSNVVVQGGIRPGYTELQTNGMIRWNESLLNHEGWNGTEWAPIAGSVTTNDLAAYLPLAGGTLSGQLNVPYIRPNDTTGGTEGHINFAVDDEGVFGGPWSFAQQPTIPGYINTNNLSTIAGSGLDVVAHQLVVTNRAAAFEELTGSRFVLGQGELSDITDSSQGSFISGIASNVNFRGFSHGSHVIGSFLGPVESGASSFGSSFVGSSPSTSTNKISPANLGNQQRGYFVGTASIGYNNLGQSFSGGSYGASQFGYLRGTATINGHGAMQIMGGVTPGEVYYSTGKGSLLLGPGTNSVDYSILANGPIQTLSGFEGNAAGLTNFPAIFAPIPVSANYTSVSYNFVLADTSSADIFVTLPAANVNSGKVVAARKMSPSNTLYMKTSSGDLVQGVGTVGVVRAGNVIEVISSGGTDWWLK